MKRRHGRPLRGPRVELSAQTVSRCGSVVTPPIASGRCGRSSRGGSWPPSPRSSGWLSSSCSCSPEATRSPRSSHRRNRSTGAPTSSRSCSTQVQDFAVGPDGRSIGQVSMVLSTSEEPVTIQAGTPGTNDCPGLGQVGQCALLAQLLGDAVISFRLIPMGPLHVRATGDRGARGRVRQPRRRVAGALRLRDRPLGVRFTGGFVLRVPPSQSHPPLPLLPRRERDRLGPLLATPSRRAAGKSSRMRLNVEACSIIRPWAAPLTTNSAVGISS